MICMYMQTFLVFTDISNQVEVGKGLIQEQIMVLIQQAIKTQSVRT